MRTIGIIKNVAGALLVTVTTALALTACHPDDDPGTGGTDGGMITVSRLEVGIESIGATTGTRAGDAGTRAEGDTYAGVKTKFVDGDVIHLYVSSAVKEKFANATYTASTTDGTPGTWSISPALVLPNDVTGANILALYDGKNTEYKGEQEFIIALAAAAAGVTIGADNNPALATDNASDALMASNADGLGGSITLGANGALAIKLGHTNALIRLGQVENRLNKEIKTVEAVVYEKFSNQFAKYRRIPLNMTNADDYTGAEAFSYVFDENAPYVLTSFIVTINDSGSTSTEGDEELIIPVPDATGSAIKDAEGKPVTGQPVLSGKRYTYHLVLAPGMLTATLDGNSIPSWNDKGQLLTAPTGYIPLYSAEDLKKIGVKDESNSEYTYTYTDASGITQSLPYSLDGNYILMADIDLSTSGDWTPIGPNYANYFKGRFNGNGHTIMGMRVNTNEDYAGFFRAIDEATIYNLHFKGASVSGTKNYSSVGTLAGKAVNSSIALCSATGSTVSGNYFSGGLVGSCEGSHLTRCYAIDCTVTGNSVSNSYAGGLVGYSSHDNANDYSTILTACYTAGCTVTASISSSTDISNLSTNNSYAGGLMGFNDDYSGMLYGCYALYAAVTVTGNDSNYPGALVGYFNSKTSVISCYATNNTSTAGGSASNMLVGGIGNNTKSIITGCISPLKDPGSDTSAPSETLIDYSGVIGNGGNGTTYGITYRDGTDGYAPLVGSSISDCSDVRTVIVNTTGGNVTENGSSSVTIPPGGIYFVSRTWKAASIWKPINNGNKMNAPFIDWSYEGE